jgi:hypothetical protein
LRYDQRGEGDSPLKIQETRAGSVVSAFAASPRSASQTSPCLAAIDNVEDFLLDLARANQVKGIVVG